jgi:hypothetical protein
MNMDTTCCTDAALWVTTLARASNELAALPVTERNWLAEQVRRIGELQAGIDRLFREVDGPAICADCLGGCCGGGRHHVTLTNLLGYLLAGKTPPAPDFSRSCPQLGAEGCRLPAEHRPFNCIIFFCERIDNSLTDAQRSAVAGIEAELRSTYHGVAERCPGAGLRGLLIAAARLDGRPLLANS